MPTAMMVGGKLKENRCRDEPWPRRLPYSDGL